MFSGKVLFFVVSTAFCTTRCLSQITFNSILTDIGVIRTTHSEREMGPSYAFYPELQAGGDFFSRNVRWAAYWGYWWDGMTEPRPWPDFVTYSYRSHILGLRLAYYQPGSPLPVGVFAGVAHHFASAEYIGGAGLDGQRGSDFTLDFNSFEVGLTVELALAGPFSLSGKFEELILIGREEDESSPWSRQAYQIGLGVKF